MMNKKSISILVPAEDYLVSDDKRLLIPFMENGKIGLMDKAVKNGRYPFSENGDIRSLLSVQK